MLFAVFSFASQPASHNGAWCILIVLALVTIVEEYHKNRQQLRQTEGGENMSSSAFNKKSSARPFTFTCLNFNEDDRLLLLVVICTKST
jgi:hypothetical protein